MRYVLLGHYRGNRQPILRSGQYGHSIRYQHRVMQPALPAPSSGSTQGGTRLGPIIPVTAQAETAQPGSG